jgi:hypothetical protein
MRNGPCSVHGVKRQAVGMCKVANSLVSHRSTGELLTVVYSREQLWPWQWLCVCGSRPLGVCEESWMYSSYKHNWPMFSCALCLRVNDTVNFVLFCLCVTFNSGLLQSHQLTNGYQWSVTCGDRPVIFDRTTSVWVRLAPTWGILPALSRPKLFS